MQVGGVEVDAERVRTLQLVDAVAATDQADAEHPGPARRQQVPRGVPDGDAVEHRGVHPVGRREEDLRVGLGVLDVGAADERRLLRQVELLDVGLGSCGLPLEAITHGTPASDSASSNSLAPGSGRTWSRFWK